MTAARDSLKHRVGRYLVEKLERQSPGFRPYAYGDPAALRRALRPADVLLVEGSTRVSIAIKYLTQSTWSHSALYVGDALGDGGEDPRCLIEANIGEGVIASPLSKYDHAHVRICRPKNLSKEDRARVIDFMVGSIGKSYDAKNVADLARFLMPMPPVPIRWRRQMLALGAGDPTRAICSTLIAEAFERVRYPILPRITRELRHDAAAQFQRREILHIRHHSLFAPRDFDISPYFEIVKPTLKAGFDYRRLHWSDASEDVTSRAQGTQGN
ncbi:YiiX/YebB-like N1pC/P60 family cysteine hydrolase [Amaricoccus sp.]|uniref:YiiX/YebB-like N1pC/P60 family cysteine hydrolase n=1 Tax=Amaricoccus sp. TaxID=1872485 RepID=UPI001B6DD8A7|nr:YiiX/YebB-like N1pC/P60 family cysteine hydrolase [Amaricoccus sp.]MBP7242816.1 lipo-like protein [Amaricoccus sp.]